MKEKNTEREIGLGIRSIKSAFETGEIKKMYELSDVNPTKVATALGMNQGRYVGKLAHPERFSIKEVVKFSLFTGADILKVMDAIIKEAVPNVKAIEADKTKKKIPSRKVLKTNVTKKAGK